MKPHNNNINPKRQHKQAGIFLLKLQWGLLILLTIMVFWLYSSQKSFQQKMLVLQSSNAQEIARLRDIDDKLYAIDKQDKETVAAKQDTIKSEQNKHDFLGEQLNILRIQLQVADKMLTDANYHDIIVLLDAIKWQLLQENNNISPALNTVLIENINKDIEQLNAYSNQPSPWQLQNLAINDIQRFLHSQISLQLTDAQLNQPLSQYDAMVYETIITLNLAIQANNIRQQDMMVMYLQQAKKQLIDILNYQKMALNTKMATSNIGNHKLDKSTTKHTSQLMTPRLIDNNQQKKQDNNKQRPDLNTLEDVMVWLDDIISTNPKPIRLSTLQILEDAKEAKNRS